MIDGEKIFDQSIKKYIKTYENIQKIIISQRDDYTISFLLHYNYFIKHELIGIDLSRQQAFDAYPKNNTTN